MSDAEVTTPHPEQDALTVGDEAAAGLKRKRVVLSIHDKQQVLLRLQGGEQPIAIAREFGISRQQVSDIKKNRERIVAFCTDAKHMSTLKRKTLKATCEFTRAWSRSSTGGSFASADWDAPSRLRA
ncbi:hypothetical protein PRIC1_000003 [Phytophthora ramorum]